MNPQFQTQRFKPEDVIYACNLHGEDLTELPPGVDGVQLMLAFASIESATGFNCGPRYEPAYDVGGSFWKISAVQRTLVDKFNGGACCSFGPWQMMYCNFPMVSFGLRDITPPTNLLTRSDKFMALVYAEDFVFHFNQYVPRLRPNSLEDIAEIWNSGHIVRATETGYATKLVRGYSEMLNYKRT